MKTHNVLFPVCALAFLNGCDKAPSTTVETSPAGVAAGIHKSHAAGKTEGCCNGAGAGGCEHQKAAAATPENVRTITTKKGETIQIAGQKLTNAAPVNVTDLLAKGEAYAGKMVRLEGNVAAMCHHSRSWFAVVGDDQSGSHVRVLTTPAFRVPRGSIGKSVRTEGTVQIIEVAAAKARHLAESHKLGEVASGDQAIKQVVLRAVAAEFN